LTGFTGLTGKRQAKSKTAIIFGVDRLVILFRQVWRAASRGLLPKAYTPEKHPGEEKDSYFVIPAGLLSRVRTWKWFGVVRD